MVVFLLRPFNPKWYVPTKIHTRCVSSCLWFKQHLFCQRFLGDVRENRGSRDLTNFPACLLTQWGQQPLGVCILRGWLVFFAVGPFQNGGVQFQFPFKTTQNQVPSKTTDPHGEPVPTMKEQQPQEPTLEHYCGWARCISHHLKP